MNPLSGRVTETHLVLIRLKIKGCQALPAKGRKWLKILIRFKNAIPIVFR